MSTLIVLLIALVVSLVLIYGIHKYLKKKNGDIIKVHETAIYNGKDTNPPLSTWNNVGFKLYGNFRMDTNGSYVKYLFFCIFFPLIPIGCYRATEGITKDLGRVGAARKRTTDYTIYGTEKWNFLEVLYIYLIDIAILLVCFIIYNIWDPIYLFLRDL